MWSSVETKFSLYHALNNGISGSEVSDLLYFKDRLISKFSPRAVVIYSGDNDLASGKSVDDVFRDFKQLVLSIRSEQYQKIFIFGVKQSLKRIENRFKIIQLNEKLKDLAFIEPDVIFLDFNPLILDRNGLPDKQFFASDLLHFNEAGYLVLEQILLNELKFHPELK